jgi:hypothetical protein
MKKRPLLILTGTVMRTVGVLSAKPSATSAIPLTLVSTGSPPIRKIAGSTIQTQFGSVQIQKKHTRDQNHRGARPPGAPRWYVVDDQPAGRPPSHPAIIWTPGHCNQRYRTSDDFGGWRLTSSQISMALHRNKITILTRRLTVCSP